MKTGIIGLPGSGKTTIFEALTHQVGSEAHRGEPRLGTVVVPDDRVDRLSEMYKPRKTIHAQMEYFLPGRAEHKTDESQSMWNQVRDCDALIHVVRNFTAYGADAPDPGVDLLEIEQELLLADQVVVEKRLERLSGDHKKGKKASPEEITLMRECLSLLESETPLRNRPDMAEAPALKGFGFLTAKPKLVLFNNMDDDNDPPDVGSVLDPHDRLVIKGKLEQELAQMSPEEADEFLAEFEITASALDRVIQRSYALLGLISFFTVGEDEVRAWTITRGLPALEAAGVIHTDLMKGFIRAEVVSYEDIMDAGSYSEARRKGTVRLEGKTYEVRDGDIITVRFNV